MPGKLADELGHCRRAVNKQSGPLPSKSHQATAADTTPINARPGDPIKLDPLRYSSCSSSSHVAACIIVVTMLTSAVLPVCHPIGSLGAWPFLCAATSRVGSSQIVAWGFSYM